MCSYSIHLERSRKFQCHLRKGPSENKVYILLLAPRPAGKARATSIPAAVCKERATQPGGLRAAARRGAAAGGGLTGAAAPAAASGSPLEAAPPLPPRPSPPKTPPVSFHR